MKYKGYVCPACENTFSDTDDIVVCPDCGAPYHRDCYVKNNKCAYKDKHSDHFSWQDEVKKNDAVQDKVCQRCGSENLSDAERCVVCGYPTFQIKRDDVNYTKTKINTEEPNTGEQRANMPPNVLNFMQSGIGKSAQVEFDYLGGVSAEDTIDGESVADVATSIWFNTQYYLPKFKEMSEKKKKLSWNWPAFLFPQIWYFFRKCYFQGFAALVINVSISAVTNWVLFQFNQIAGEAGTFDEMLKLANDPAMMEKLTPYTLMFMGISLLFIINNLFWGLLGNHFYKNRVIESIKKHNQKAKEENYSVPERIAFLGQKGGINIAIPLVVLLFSSSLVSLLLSFVMS